jgi:hypothetical protein
MSVLLVLFRNAAVFDGLLRVFLHVVHFCIRYHASRGNRMPNMVSKGYSAASYLPSTAISPRFTILRTNDVAMEPSANPEKAGRQHRSLSLDCPCEAIFRGLTTFHFSFHFFSRLIFAELQPVRSPVPEHPID